MASPYSLIHKVCLITGSSRGIGWEIAQKFASEGATCILNCRSDKALLDERKSFLEEKYSADVMLAVGDCSDESWIRDTYQEIFKRFKRLDVLVNNAGVLADGILGMLSGEKIESTFKTNAVGPLLNMQAAARLMGRKRAGSIINLSSIMALEGIPGQSIYSGSKAAIVGLTKTVSQELGPNGIRVNAISPGLIDTEMIQGVDEETLAERVRLTALGRVGSPEDVANLALFFASDASQFITGQIVGVDGGLRF